MSDPTGERDSWNPSLCYWCGEREATEDAHVVPRGWFLKPISSDLNLPVVPSCEDCNQDQQVRDDEELVSAMFAATFDVDGQEFAPFHDKVIRGLSVNPRVLGKLLESMFTIENAKTEGGIHMGDMPALDLDQPAVDRLIERIVRGLYYDEWNERLNADISVDWRVAKPQDTKLLWRGWKLHELGEVFSYRCGLVPDHPTKSIWFMLFYRSAFVVAVTDMRERLDEFAKQDELDRPKSDILWTPWN